MSQRDGMLSTSVGQWMEQLDQLNIEVQAALDANDSSTVARKCLEGILMSPLVWGATRYGLFGMYRSVVLRKEFTPTEYHVNTLTTKFVDNEDEPVLYRSMAVHILGNWKLRAANNDDDSLVAIEYLRKAASLCDSASRRERKRSIQVPNRDGSSAESRLVGSVLDDLKSAIQTELEYYTKYQADPYAFTMQKVQEITKSNDRAFVEEFAQTAVRHVGDPDAIFTRPPVITSSIIESVKSLPQQDISILIYEDKRSKEDLPPAIRGCRVYKAFQVDLTRWRAGRTTKVFDMMKILFCYPNQPRARHLVGTFAATCLKPFVLEPMMTQTHPSFRPTTVFFETDEDASHPMVQSFLSMMGCSDIRVIDDGAKHLLEITMPDVLKASEKHVFTKEEFPHLHDHLKGRVCGNCRMSGRKKLLVCSCGGAYYCSKQCQTAKWKEHKVEHAEFLSQKNAKQERRAKRDDNIDANK